jgi:hypothetical protein
MIALITSKERRRIKQRDYSRVYRLRHPDRVRIQTLRYRSKTPREQRLEVHRRYRRKKIAANPLWYAQQLDSWRAKHQQRWNVICARWKRKRYAMDPIYRMRLLLQSSIFRALRKQRLKKLDDFLNLVGCSPEQLRQHIEKQFQPGMNWSNKGRFGWHIDHRKPCASFDLTRVEEQKRCFHFTNLQPLWWRENLEKRDRICL